MNLDEAISLISEGFSEEKNVETWTDLGCGSGLFTNAIAEFIHPKSKIFAVDSLKQKFNFQTEVDVQFLQKDFVKDDLNFQNLDGILMANSLHYVEDKISLLEKLCSYLHSNGKFIIIEYETENANP